MSDHGTDAGSTQNEFEAPGTNRPDTAKTDEAPREGGPATDPHAAQGSDPTEHDLQQGGMGGTGYPFVDRDHHGQDGERDTAGEGDTQREPSDRREQSSPIMSQNNATADEKIHGIMQQMRIDLPSFPHEELVRVLNQRFTQSGVDVTPERVEELARQLRS
jgi:hypothetical protein